MDELATLGERVEASLDACMLCTDAVFCMTPRVSEDRGCAQLGNAAGAVARRPCAAAMTGKEAHEAETAIAMPQDENYSCPTVYTIHRMDWQIKLWVVEPQSLSRYPP